MASDPIVLLWDRYGWLGFLGYVMVREVWPFMREKIWPMKVAQVKAERERLSKLEERQSKANDRQTEAIEAMGKSVHEMTVAITSNNERLSQLIAGHATHSEMVASAIALMRERTGGVERRKGKMI